MRLGTPGDRDCRRQWRKMWDFKSRSASVTFVEWTRFLPDFERALRQRCSGSLPGRRGRSARRGEYFQVLSNGCHTRDCMINRMKSIHLHTCVLLLLAVLVALLGPPVSVS